MQKYAFSNAEQDNLWDALNEQAKIDSTLDSSLTVKQIMDTWTTRKGYPVVNVTRLSNKLTLTQNWFLLNPLNKIQTTSEYKKYRWYIPFTYTTKQELNFEFETKPQWFRPDEEKCK